MKFWSRNTEIEFLFTTLKNNFLTNVMLWWVRPLVTGGRPVWHWTKEFPMKVMLCNCTRCTAGLGCMLAIRKAFTFCFANPTACIPSLSKPTASCQTIQPNRHTKSETSSLARENSCTAFPLGNGSSVAYSICSVMFYYLALWHLPCYF